MPEAGLSDQGVPSDLEALFEDDAEKTKDPSGLEMLPVATGGHAAEEETENLVD